MTQRKHVSYEGACDGQLGYLLHLLQLRKDRRWRAGVLQGFRTLGVLTQPQWKDLTAQWVTHSRVAKATRGEP